MTGPPAPPRTEVWTVPGDPPVVVKRATPERVASEARALRRVAGLGIAPRLVAVGGDVLVATCAPGDSGPVARRGPAALRALGAVVRRVHDLRHGATGRWAHWPARARSPGAYRRRYAAEAREAAAAAGLGALAAGVLAALPPLPAAGERPFRLLHGDLWGGNVLWRGRAPALVDWEDSRIGDPAEELAYLAEMDALPPRALAAVLEGYGEPGMGERVAAWRPLVALSAGLWYLAEGAPDRADVLLAQAGERALLRRPPAPSPRPRPRARARRSPGRPPSGSAGTR